MYNFLEIDKKDINQYNRSISKKVSLLSRNQTCIFY